MQEHDPIKEHILEHQATLNDLLSSGEATKLHKMAGLIHKTFSNGGKLLIFGNGGSASQAQHTAAEFVGRFSKNTKRPPLPAIALTTDTSILTAVSNDFGFDQIFARQIEALANPEKDMLMVLSTSGTSPNTLRATENIIPCVALLGADMSPLDMGCTCLHVPSISTPIIQEIHTVCLHILVTLVENMAAKDMADYTHDPPKTLNTHA